MLPGVGAESPAFSLLHRLCYCKQMLWDWEGLAFLLPAPSSLRGDDTGFSLAAQH